MTPNHLLTLLSLAVISINCLAIQTPTPTITLTTNHTHGKVDDKIVISWQREMHNKPLERTEITMDGAYIHITNGTREKGDYTWQATSGEHFFRYYIRWIDDKQRTKLHLQKIIKFTITPNKKQKIYIHPGLSLSQHEIDTIKENLNSKQKHPMQFSKNTINVPINYTPHPHKQLDMHNTEVDRNDWDRDARAVQRYALNWAITNNENSAKQGIKILMAWTNNCEEFVTKNRSVYPFLHTTHLIHRWLEAAEILKHYNGGYKGWSKKDKATFDKQYVRKHLVPLSLAWQGNIGNPFGTQNQPLNVAKARIMLGIYLDDQSLFDSGYNLLLNKKLFSKKYQQIFGKNPINLLELSINKNGEFMEVNRDFAHMSMCVASLQIMAEVLWHQGIDLYSLKIDNETTPRFLKGIQWLTKATLENGAESSRKGKIKFRRKFRLGSVEQLYNHYQYRLKGKYQLPENFIQYLKSLRERKAKSWISLLYADLSKPKT